MANTDALSAIKDIKEALAEYGSSIEIETPSETSLTDYDPLNPQPELPPVITTGKGIISSEATPNVGNAYLNSEENASYQLAIKTYLEGKEVTKNDKLVFNGSLYEIVYVANKILQDTLILQEILVRK